MAGRPVLDLCYAEDSTAGTDGNFILTGRGRLIEVQMSAEGATFSREEMGQLLDLAEADQVSERAAILLDKVLFGLAVNSFRGAFSGSKGSADTGSVLIDVETAIKMGNSCPFD